MLPIYLISYFSWRIINDRGVKEKGDGRASQRGPRSAEFEGLLVFRGDGVESCSDDKGRSFREKLEHPSRPPM